MRPFCPVFNNYQGLKNKPRNDTRLRGMLEFTAEPVDRETLNVGDQPGKYFRCREVCQPGSVACGSGQENTVGKWHMSHHDTRAKSGG
jgi:hypothetical protein